MVVLSIFAFSINVCFFWFRLFENVSTNLKKIKVGHICQIKQEIVVESTQGTTPTHQIDDQLESETHNNKKRQKYMYIYMLSCQACISWGKDKNLISTNYRQPLWTLPAKTLCPKESGLPLFPLQPPCFRGYCILVSVHDDAFHDDCGREVRRTSEDSFLTSPMFCVPTCQS